MLGRRGEILFVNNRITLHDMQPYCGVRRMTRVRFNDSLNLSTSY